MNVNFVPVEDVPVCCETVHGSHAIKISRLNQNLKVNGKEKDEGKGWRKVNEKAVRCRRRGPTTHSSGSLTGHSHMT